MARFVAGDGAVKRPTAACGGGRQYPPLELLFRWREAPVVASTSRGGGVVSCGVARTLAGGSRVEFLKLAVGHRGRTLRRPAHGQQAAPA
jgi:hypothetical protein